MREKANGMDWSSIFDEVHRQPGASAAIIAQFVAEVARPLSAAEIREIKARQSNPFPASDALHAVWRPFHASKWSIPNRPLPAAYLSLLRWSNGGEFRTGERLFQFFPALDPQHGVRAMMLGYNIPEYMPGAVPFAFDGCGTFYLFDMRQQAVEAEYPVVLAHAGFLGWEEDACGRIADSLVAACLGTGNADSEV